MAKTLQLLETARMQGDDGQRYVVRAYEHLAELAWDLDGRMEPTGVVEYKLDDGRHVHVDGDGRMRIAGTGITLSAEQGSAPSFERREAGSTRRALPEHARP